MLIENLVYGNVGNNALHWLGQGQLGFIGFSLADQRSKKLRYKEAIETPNMISILLGSETKFD
jgi:hypothetical protein